MTKDYEAAKAVFETVLGKLRNERILNERRKRDFVYSLPSSWPEIKRIEKEVAEQTGVKKDDVEPYDMDCENIDITVSSVSDCIPKNPVLSTEYHGFWFPVGRSGKLWVDIESLEFYADDNVTERHLSKIEKISRELRKEFRKRKKT